MDGVWQGMHQRGRGGPAANTPYSWTKKSVSSATNVDNVIQTIYSGLQHRRLGHETVRHLHAS